MMSASKATDDNISKDKDVHAPDVEAVAWDIQNRASHRVGMATMEARHFREFFGMIVLVIEKRELNKRDSLLPEKSRPKHLLGALHFMKIYPKQSPGCVVVGASAGAIDQKTHCKWVWAFTNAIANMVNVVGSKLHYNVGTTHIVSYARM